MPYRKGFDPIPYKITKFFHFCCGGWGSEKIGE